MSWLGILLVIAAVAGLIGGAFLLGLVLGHFSVLGHRPDDAADDDADAQGSASSVSSNRHGSASK